MVQLRVLSTASLLLLLAGGLAGVEVQVTFEGEVIWADISGLSRGQPVSGRIIYVNTEPPTFQDPSFRVYETAVTHYEVRIGTTEYVAAGGTGTVALGDDVGADFITFASGPGARLLGPILDSHEPNSLYLQLRSGSTALLPSLDLSSMKTKYGLRDLAAEPLMGIMFSRGGDLDFRAHFALHSLEARPLLSVAATSAPVSSIRLEDIVAGGDGSGNAPSVNTGIDPRTGLFTTNYFEGFIADSDGLNPQPVRDSPYIDSVFFLKSSVPTAQDGCGGCFIQYITQTGIQLLLDDAEDTNGGWNFILKDRVGGVTAPGIRVGGFDHFGSSIGLHASEGITFDLDELRARHGAGSVGCFSGFWGLDDCSIGLVHFLAMISNDAQGVIDIRQVVFGPGQGGPVTLPIPETAQYLTLACSSMNGNINCDHGTIARPVIVPLTCPDRWDGWISRITPWRVAPGGAEVLIEGEALFDGYSIRVNGVDLPDQVYLGDTLRSARTPPFLPAGTYDVELVDGFGFPLQRLPGAIEVAGPPVILSATPDKILTDRRVLCRFEGQNLRPDMEIIVSTSESGSEKLADQEFLSPEFITGKIPLLPHVSGSPVFLLDQGRLFEFPVSLLFVEIGLEKVEPVLVPTVGGSVVTFHGMGFEPGMTFLIDSSSLLDVEIIDAGHASGRTPPLAPGFHSVSLVHTNGAVMHTIPDALLAQASSSPEILSFAPQTVSTRGGDLLAISTSSWHGAATARLRGSALTNLDTTEPTVLRGESPPLDPGFHALELVGLDGIVLARIDNAIQAVPPGDVTLIGVTPFEVASTGGTPVFFTGTGFEAGLVPRLGGLPLTQVEVIDGEHLRGLSPPLAEGLHDAAVTEGNALRARLDDAVEALPLVTGPVPVVGRPPATHFAAGADRIDIAASGIPAGAVLRVGGVAVTAIQPTSPCSLVGGDGGGAGVGAGGGHTVYEGLVPELPPGRYAVDFYLPGQGIVTTLEEAVEVISPTSPPLASHVVSADVLPDGSTRLHIFGSCFGASTAFLLGGKPVADASIVSPRLAVGHAPALGPGEPSGPRNLEVLDPRGNSTLIAAVVYVDPDGVTFVRGDVNQSGAVDISDAVTILGYLFLGSPTTLDCFGSADIDEGGDIDITDPIQLLGHLFLGGAPPRPPYPTCGKGSPDAAETCESFEPCAGEGGSARGGGAGVIGGLKPNVFVLAEERTSPGEPILRDVSPVSGEVVIDDPPGGVDLAPGDVIAGYVPVTSAAIHEGVTYLVKLEGEQPGSCLATQPGDRTYVARPASLAETFTDAALDFELPGSAVERRYSSDAVVATGNTLCDLAESGQGGGAADGSGGAFDPLIDVTFEGLNIFSWQDGPNYIHAGFHKLRVLYAASEASLGVGISGARLTGASFFSGILLDAELLPYIDSHFEQHITKEKKLATLRKDHIVVVFGVPIHFAATGDLYAGVDLDAHVNLYADAGAKASFKAGVGFRFDGSRIHNLSGIDPPTLESLPGTPNLDLNGALVAKAYVRPETHLFAGILFRGLTADIGTRSEAFLRFHAAGETQPVPCFRWGLDAGMKVTLIPEIQLFGFDLFDRTFDVINLEEIDLLSDEYGCKFAPVPRVSYRLVKLAEGKYEVHLDASASYDPDGGPLRFRWDFDADGQCDRATRNDPRTMVVMEHACSGPFVVSLGGCSRGRAMVLRVTDDEDRSVEKRFTVILR